MKYVPGLCLSLKDISKANFTQPNNPNNTGKAY
jgi:hypothetical protein